MTTISSVPSLRSSGSGASRAAFGGRCATPIVGKLTRKSAGSTADAGALGAGGAGTSRMRGARGGSAFWAATGHAPAAPSAASRRPIRRSVSRIAEPLPPTQRLEPVARSRRQPRVGVARRDPRIQEREKVGIAFVDREAGGARQQRAPRRYVD